MAQGKLRALKVPEAGGALKDAHGEEQDQKAVANTYHGGVDAGDGGPNITALEALRRLRQQGPYLGQFAVPVCQGALQDAYDPVVTHNDSPP